MTKALTRAGIVLLVLVAALGAAVLALLVRGGQFRTLHAHFDGQCRDVPMGASAEDIRIDPARGIAYLSYFDRRGLIEKKVDHGTVMLVDLNAAELRPRAALATDPPQFRPHGMSLWIPQDGGPQVLFVISHLSGNGHSIEIFEQNATGAFAPVQTIRDALLVRPNAILAVGPRQFYVANDSGAANGFQRMQEMVLGRGLSALAYYDGARMRAAATGLKSAAGIAASPDGRTVYVSETAGNRLQVFERDAASGALRAKSMIDVGSAPDNLFVEPDGTVWLAAHAKTVALVRHFGNAENPAPTQIFRMKPGSSSLEEVFLDTGERFSAGSVAAVRGRRMLVGSITERRILDCTLP